MPVPYQFVSCTILLRIRAYTLLFSKRIGITKFLAKGLEYFSKKNYT